MKFFCRVKLYVLLLFFGSPFVAFPQLFLNDIDFNMVGHKSIMDLLDNLKSLEILTFNDVRPSCGDGGDLTGFGKDIRHYRVKADVDRVWETYNLASPSQSWQSRMVGFGFLYNRDADDVLYNDFDYDGLDEGQVVYLNLRLLKGAYNLATAFEIVTVDSENRIIAFSYIEGGKSRGIQTICFVPHGNNKTLVTHTSYFKSGSKFRDKYLYVHFHKKIINRFHRNIRKLI